MLIATARSWKRSQLSFIARVLRCRSWRSELACRHSPTDTRHRDAAAVASERFVEGERGKLEAVSYVINDEYGTRDG